MITEIPSPTFRSSRSSAGQNLKYSDFTENFLVCHKNTANMAEEVGRPMKYPYTLAAKITQFPWKYYFKHSWGFRYAVYASLLCTPIFYKIQKMSYTPANVKKWDEIHRKEFYGEDHH